MTNQSSKNEFDAIVIGSGMGGLTTATALARFDHKVLLLEQAQAIGGLTHSFSRDGFSWDVGLHYCGLFGRGQPAGKILDWLSGGTIKFQSIGPVYDTLHFPGDFEIAVSRPAEAYQMTLKDRFPDQTSEIDAYFDALKSAEAAMRMATAERSMPEPFRVVHRWWNDDDIQHWCARTTGEVIADTTSHPKLAAVLSAQWGTYGGPPNQASFGIHATIMRHYQDGAGYPVGGASTIAAGLAPVIEKAGGVVRADAPVSEILIEGGGAVGVRISSGETFKAPVVVSAAGAGETVKRLLPDEAKAQGWAQEVASFKPSVCHFDLYLGFEGDIARYGATRANHWFYEDWRPGADIWNAADGSSPPMLFVSFPSLKNAAHDPGPSQKHTGQVMVLADWASVAEFADGGAERRPEEWKALKKRVQETVFERFAEKFPALAPMVVFQELGTPLATAFFTRHDKGGFYGVETTPRRVLSQALAPRTPTPGLFLTGQDVMSPGIAGALYGGMLGAAAVDPRIYQKLV